MIETNESMIRKVKSMLAKAESTINENEREVFLNKAQELIQQYNITNAQLTNQSEDEWITDWRALQFENGGPVTRRLMSLASSIANNLGVATTLFTTKQEFYSGTVLPAVNFYGRRSSIEATKVLYTLLSVTALNNASKLKAYRVENPDPRKYAEFPLTATKAELRAGTQSLRMGYLEGFNDSVYIRMREQNAALDQESDGSLLPMLGSDLQRAKSMIGKTKKAASRYSSGASAGYTAGSRDGNKVSLNQASMPKTQKAIGSGS